MIRWPARAYARRPDGVVHPWAACGIMTRNRYLRKEPGIMALDDTDRKPDDVNSGGIAADRLRSIIDRIERLEEERKALGSDIKDIYSEAKSAGFDVKVIRQLIRIRKQEPAEVEEMESLLDVYRRALGM
ncbi:putative exported protein [Granulibacter bethesdensis]|uniref:UPF0335 protein GbCGDNIH1_0366 n=2 Tax=Granulibacter bethesdensis TaxID=364410 RepID=Q0BV88_GRABC|nr:putative exported protein [Granulibacter bethesdensis CGDNIH1]AHJ67374.1 putative exported protein [Granulibacter bethesdensis]APH51050.1 putative exported protein [Granulibacter bethesdensis]APH63744.1 putative exported protein [Granulibacter bethesdensis]